MDSNNNTKNCVQPTTYDENKNELEILLEEYSACNEGYNSRDLIVFSEFSVLIAIFSGLIVAMVYVLDKLQKEAFSLSLTIFILGILGLLSMIGISVDLQSTHSCKVAIRNRMKTIEDEIEEKIGSKNKLMILWREIIENRDKYWLEEKYKPKDREIREKEIDLLNSSAYVLIILWVLIVVIFLWLSSSYPVIYMIFIIIFILISYMILFEFEEVLKMVNELRK